MAFSGSTPTKGNSFLLTDSEFALVAAAFNSFLPDPNSNADHANAGAAAATLDVSVPLTELLYRFNSSEHPRVRDGTMAPSAARDTLHYQFDTCAAEHRGSVTFDEFLTYHEKIVDEAYDEQGVSEVDSFIRRTIMGLWRLGNDLLLPTGVRPCFPTQEVPKGMYASALMTLVWPEPDPDHPGRYIIHGVKDVVRPVFKRGDLPEELQGYFAYPEELTGMAVQYEKPQISIQRWLDVVWCYAEGKYCGVAGIVSARVDLEGLPLAVRELVVEHDKAVKELNSVFVPTTVAANPMYKRTSDSYGYGVGPECKKLHAWKVRSLKGTQYGLQYHGLQGKFFSKMKGPITGNAATGINL